MLISFSVRNFRSIYEEQQLTFIATKYGGLSDGLLRVDGSSAKLLPLIAIYGANAAGKTNMLKALHFFCKAVSLSHNEWKPEARIQRSPHFFHRDESTKFECVFRLQKQTYRLGFSLDDEKVVSEYLYAGKNRIYFRKGNTYRLGPPMEGFESVKKNTRANSLFISAVAQNNHPLLKKIHAWFSSWNTVTEDRSPEEALTAYMMEDDELRSFFTKAVSIINPDIIGLELPEVDSSESPDSKRSFEKDLESWSRIRFVHRSADGKKKARVRLVQESRGTQCYFSLAGSILMALHSGSILLLDEADQSLHPTLLRSIISLFQSPRTNPRRAQLIFNTHDTSILMPDVIRPDEVWFVERDTNSNSIFYCLADFEGVRSETKAQRAYLEGRFGAVPFLEQHAKLFAKELEPSSGKKNA
jgi:AAA15 family ATPase/GTPase